MTAEWKEFLSIYNEKKDEYQTDLRKVLSNPILQMFLHKMGINLTPKMFGNITHLDAVAVACSGDLLDVFDTSGSIAAIVAMSILLLMVVGSSVKEAVSNEDTDHWLQKKHADSVLSQPLLDSPEGHKRREEREKKSKEKSIWYVFSVERNLARLVSVPKGGRLTEQLSPLNGIRTLSMFWIILGHVYLYGQSITPGQSNSANQYMTGGAITKFYFQLIPGAEFSVDTFFFMSGLLVIHSLVPMIRKSQHKLVSFASYAQNYGSMLLHRYLRLTPALAFMIMVFINVTPYVGDGPYFRIEQQGNQVQHCYASWWMDLLYINNFAVKMNQDCAGWTWYLANDFQFFIITPFFVYLYLRSKSLGVGLVVATLVGCIVADFFIVIQHNSPFNMLSSHYGKDYSDTFYNKPWCRAPAYLIGVLYGFLLDEDKIYEYLSGIQHFVIRMCVELWTALLLFTLPFATYWLYKDAPGALDFINQTPHYHEWIETGGWNRPFTVFFIVLSRPAWVLALACGMTVLIFGYGGIIRRFLSLSLWVPLARLTYGAYLWHIVLMTVIFASRVQSDYFSMWDLFVTSTFYIVAAYLVSMVQYLIIEKPFMNLEDILFRSGGKEKREKGERMPTLTEEYSSTAVPDEYTPGSKPRRT
jgi:peptidoglycan/LPS O-acetylase OafA/YrhL